MTKQCAVSACTKERIARGYCKSHYRRYMKYGDPEHVVASDIKPASSGHRVCSKCDNEKPLESYHKSSRNAEGRTRACKDCLNTYQAEWSADNSERVKETRRRGVVRSKYGEAGLVQLERIKRKEGCDACGVYRNRMAIDHDHSTGRVRGILCPQCNTSLGLLGEDYQRFTALVAYLINHMEVTEEDDMWLKQVAAGLTQEREDDN